MSTISSFSFLFPPFSVEEIGEKVFLVLIIINLFAFIIGFIEEFDYLYDSYKKCEKEDECDSKDEKPEDQKLGGIMFFRVLLVIKAIIISTPLFMALFQKISIWSILKKMVSAFFLTLFF